MNENLTQLLENLREDPTADGAAFAALGAAVASPDRVSVQEVVELLAAPEPVVRRAALEGARGRTEPEILAAAAALAGDSDPMVRRGVAKLLAAHPLAAPEEAVQLLLDDRSEEVREDAVAAARGREPFTAKLLDLLKRDSSWVVRQAAVGALADHPPRETLFELVAALARDPDHDVQQAAATASEGCLKTLGGWPDGLARPDPSLVEQAFRNLHKFDPSLFSGLAKWLETRTRTDVNKERLRSLGRDLTRDAVEGKLEPAFFTDALCDEIESAITGRRSVVLLGPAGSGKTSVVYALVERLAAREDAEWRVIRVSPADLMADTKYSGELETKVMTLVRAMSAPRPVILYIPELDELSHAGRTVQSEMSIATAMAPYIEDRSIVVLGESTPECYERALGSEPRLRRLFHVVSVPAATTDATRRVLAAVRDHRGAAADDALLDRIVEISNAYLAGGAQPGKAVGLFRRVADHLHGHRGPLTLTHVLERVSASTGLPATLLDDVTPLDHEIVRDFFEARVMGQPEALAAVTDLVTLIKAGLTDPGKPFGVFLFVGPTGVGKTELARALAEFIFGDVERLLRFDMSEFATYDGFQSLIGPPGRPGRLTSAVQEKPFSVVLLDEIEKAHMNVFDLCLQLFDAGRLTDGRGHTVDFRRTICILTSNVGAAESLDPSIGFGSEYTASTQTDYKKLSRWFRPEFLNRLDRIITFNPLAPDTAERIARRELAQMLEREGIRRRGLVVDVEPGVVSLLVKQGYSPIFGARPLKRAVERLVLLPVARVIAAGDLPARAVVRLARRGDEIGVEIAAEAREADSADAPPPPRLEALAARGRELRDQIDELAYRAEPLAAHKSTLLARSAESRFWDEPDSARRVLDEVHRLDGVLGSLRGLGTAIHAITERLEGRPPPRTGFDLLEERLDSLAAQARQFSILVARSDARDLGDALVCVTRLTREGDGLDGVMRLGRMYQGFARRHGLEVEVLDDHVADDPPEDTVVLLVSGGGAFGWLRDEAGLHQLVRRTATEGASRTVRTEIREAIRVEVLAAPDTADLARAEMRIQVKRLRGARGRIGPDPKRGIELFHEPSLTAVRAWTARPEDEAVAELTLLLRARIDAGGNKADTDHSPPLVRRYTFGTREKARDLRTGRTTSRLTRVLEGDLDPLREPRG